MAFHRLIAALGMTGLAIAALAFLLTFSPTSAAGVPTSGGASRMQLAPPQQGPTLIPQTPDTDGLPPLDLGSLSPPETPTATPAPAGENEVVLDLSYDDCNPIEDDFIKVECTNGALAFTRKETEGTRWIYYNTDLSDAMIEVVARLPSQKNARYGVIFRLDDSGDNFYLLGVTNEGKYGLFRFATDHYETLIPYTDSFSVGNASFPSQIKIVNQGDVIAINIGGQWLDSIRDPNLSHGKIALFVEPDEANQTVLFDNLRITSITSPIEVPEPHDVVPAETPTEEGGLPFFTSDETPTPEGAAPTQAPAATQTPFIIIVTATPLPTNQAAATKAPTRVPTRKPTQSACPVGPNEAGLLISNNYIGQLMRFTIGGGEWGTHDYNVPGDGEFYLIRMPPGTYTYTASIPGAGTAHGEKRGYNGGECVTLRFSP